MVGVDVALCDARVLRVAEILSGKVQARPCEGMLYATRVKTIHRHLNVSCWGKGNDYSVCYLCFSY